MNYRQRGKVRRNNLNLKKLFDLLKFKSLNLSLSGKIVLFGLFFLLIGLFKGWITNIEDDIVFNSFNSISGNIGYILFLIMLVLFFLTLSNNSREKLKLHSNLSFQNYYIIIFSGIFVILSGIISLSFIKGLQTLSENYIYDSGVLITIVSGVFITYGGYIARKEFIDSNIEIFVNSNGDVVENINSKDNMKLPF